ncbi:MAG: preprotein translocase subunit SecE [candidate division WOR-3 bacterium]
MNLLKKIKEYLLNVISELKKVTWAKPRELFSTTVVVIVLSLIMALFVMIFDLLFSRLLHLILR